MRESVDEIVVLLDEAVKTWQQTRRTFTEKEAMRSVWEAGYEIPIHSDPRFVLVHEGDGKQPSHWRLSSHTVANTRLLNELLSGTWDGRDLDGKLAELDQEDQRHYIFYPLDGRLTLTRQGILEPAEHERTIKLPRKMKATLDALGPQLLAHWQATGAEPWTVRRIAEYLQQCGWPDANQPNAWLYVRAWLLSRQEVKRVGQDYWLPAEQVPADVQRTRLQVSPLRMVAPSPETEGTGTPRSAPLKPPPASIKPATAPEADESHVVLREEGMTNHASWTVRLRTVNLLEGFLHVPSVVRGAYPPPVPGEEQKTILRAIWHDDETRFWLWLDRAKNTLYGPALADKLMWLEAGAKLRIEWAPEIIVLRQIGQDEAVRDEESRLVDLEALAATRGGLGGNYRRSLQAILAESPQGLTFAEVIIALRNRQQHEVHRGTIHAILYTGGFVRKADRWFAAPDSDAGARQLRAAFVETLLPVEEERSAQALSQAEYVRTRVKAIHERLSEIVVMLRGG